MKLQLGIPEIPESGLELGPNEGQSAGRFQELAEPSARGSA
ncbi:MAG: hypothetical protein OXU20_34590 [Myxococcales bacterium]|nr:hypothetical protein [Myxococcales bacterium]